MELDNVVFVSGDICINAAGVDLSQALIEEMIIEADISKGDKVNIYYGNYRHAALLQYLPVETAVGTCLLTHAPCAAGFMNNTITVCYADSVPRSTLILTKNGKITSGIMNICMQ